MTTYAIGTASVANGETTVTFAGAILGTAALPTFKAGDLFADPAQPLVPPQRLASVDYDAATAELWVGWPGTSMSADPYEVRFVDDGVRTTAQTRRYLELLGQLSSLGLQPNAFGVLADRDAYDDEAAGFIFLEVGDPWTLYIKLSAATADWDDGQTMEGAPGNRGWSPVYALASDGERRVKQLVGYIGGEGTVPTANVGEYVGAAGYVTEIGDAVDVRGATGAGATIAIGTVTTLAPGAPATVTNAGTETEAVLDFEIPEGEAATIAIGTVTTVAPGAPATVVNSGTEAEAVLEFEIPAGEAASVSIGTVTTVAPGAPATVTNSGTEAEAVLEFEIPQGATGGDGTDPGVLLTFDDGTADADPGAGRFRADNADLSAATTLFVSKTNRAGNDIANWLLGLASSTSTIKGQLILTRSGGNAQALFNFTAVTDATGYVKLAVDSHSGATGFVDGNAISLQVQKTGNAGEGDGDVVGPAGAVADRVAVFDGATGKLIKDGGALLSDFATAAQGLLADSAVQPGDLALVATSGAYADLTGKPTLGTAAEATLDLDTTLAADADDRVASQKAVRAYVLAVRDALIAAAPGALDTLDELAAALGDDANFAATVTSALAGKQPLDSDLTAIAALTTTSYGRALLELANQAALMGLLIDSSTTTKGIVELATAAEYAAGADAARALNAAEVWNSADLVVLTDAATIAVDFALGFNFGGASNAPLGLAGNRALGAPSGVDKNQAGVAWFTASGSTRTLTLNAAWKLGTGVETGPYSITTTEELGVAYVVRGSVTIVTAILRKAV